MPTGGGGAGGGGGPRGATSLSRSGRVKAQPRELFWRKRPAERRAGHCPWGGRSRRGSWRAPVERLSERGSYGGVALRQTPAGGARASARQPAHPRRSRTSWRSSTRVRWAAREAPTGPCRRRPAPAGSLGATIRASAGFGTFRRVRARKVPHHRQRAHGHACFVAARPGTCLILVRKRARRPHPRQNRSYGSAT